MVGIDQKRKQRDKIHWYDNPAADKGLQVQSRKRKRGKEQPARVEAAYKQNRYSRESEYEKQIVETGVAEYVGIAVIDDQHQQEQQYQRHQEIAEQLQIDGASGAKISFIFFFIRIEYLGNFGGNDLPFRHNELTGGNDAAGGRNARCGIGIHRIGNLGIEYKIGDYQIIHGISPEQRIHRYRIYALLYVFQQLRTCRRQTQHIVGRHLNGALLPLDIDYLGIRRKGVIGYYSTVENSTERRHHFVAISVEMKSRNLFETFGGHIWEIIIIRHVNIRRFPHLFLHLLFGLEDGEIERSEQGFIIPCTPLLVLILKAHRPRSDGGKKQGGKKQRQQFI